MHKTLNANFFSARRLCVCADVRDLLENGGVGDSHFDLSQLRLHVWSTPPEALSSRAAGTMATMAAAAGNEETENQLIYVVLGTVLGVVVLVGVVCVAMCMWRHQRQPRRAVGMSFTYFNVVHFA